MKENKGLIIGIIVAVLIICIIVVGVIVNNNKDSKQTIKSNENTKATQITESASSAFYAENGVNLKTISIEFVGNTLNLQASFANNTNENKEVDCSKFSVKTSDGTVLKVNGATSNTISANTPYRQYTFTINDEGKIKEGNIVYVYYGSISLGPVEVGKF